VAGTRDRDIGEAGVEQVRVDTGIGVNEDAFGCKALGAVTGNGVAVVEMTMLVGVRSAAIATISCRENQPDFICWINHRVLIKCSVVQHAPMLLQGTHLSLLSGANGTQAEGDAEAQSQEPKG
jgi:hypothetical protein